MNDNERKLRNEIKRLKAKIEAKNKETTLQDEAIYWLEKANIKVNEKNIEAMIEHLDNAMEDIAENWD
jgi:predicted  nucleic acid-binding Zn-ribbon protein